MTGLPPPFRLYRHERIDSTNDEVRRLAAAGEPAGAVVTAAEQTAGRGRRNRAWHSPRGNLHASLLLDPGAQPARAPELVFVAAVALRETVAEFTRAAVACKWPNDILVDGRKIAGMLLELADGLVILGVGVNLVAAPADALHPAIALAECGPILTPDELLAPFCIRLARRLDEWRAHGFAPIRAAWLAHAAGQGGPITARLADGSSLSGRFAGLAPDGALLLERDGVERRIVTADVFLAPRELADAAGD